MGYGMGASLVLLVVHERWNSRQFTITERPVHLPTVELESIDSVVSMGCFCTSKLCRRVVLPSDFEQIVVYGLTVKPMLPFDFQQFISEEPTELANLNLE